MVDPGFDDPEITPAIDCLDGLTGRDVGGNMEDLGALVDEGVLGIDPESELRTVPLAEDIELGLDAGVLVGGLVGD